MAVKKNCSVMEEYPSGIRINAPAAVRAANSAVRVSVRVLIAADPFRFSPLYPAALPPRNRQGRTKKPSQQAAFCLS